MDNIVADIERGYDLEFEDPPPKVHNFYRLLAASEEKVHNGTDVTVLQAVTHLMALKSKYNFSNQCYKDIMKLIIDLIPAKHNMLKDLYQFKNIVSGLGMNYEKIDTCEKIACCFGRSTRTTSNVCIAVVPDT
jgi:nucleoid-associated protein YejK